MSEIEDPAEEKRVAYMKAKREFAEALRVRSETERLNPSMLKVERAKPSLGERLKKTTDDMIEAKHSYDLSQKMFGNGQEKPQGNPSLNTDLLKAVIASGRNPEESEELVKRLSPYMAAAGDPAAALIVSRLGTGEKLGFKEMLDLVNLMRSSQSQSSDPAAMANAIVNAIKTGAELSKNNNSDSGTIQSLYQQMTQQQQASFDKHLDLLRERYSDQQSFPEQLQSVMALQKQLGGLGKETEAVSLKRMEMENERWAKQMDVDADLRKSKSQSEMIKQVTGGLTKALESPILRQAGRKMAESIPSVGKAASTVSQIRSDAARLTLEEPLAEIFGMTCTGCGTNHRFTRGQLTIIQSTPTQTWACPNCGMQYHLKGIDGTSSNKDDNHPTGGEV